MSFVGVKAAVKRIVYGIRIISLIDTFRLPFPGILTDQVRNNNNNSNNINIKADLTVQQVNYQM